MKRVKIDVSQSSEDERQAVEQQRNEGRLDRWRIRYRLMQLRVAREHYLNHPGWENVRDSAALAAKAASELGVALAPAAEKAGKAVRRFKYRKAKQED